MSLRETPVNPEENAHSGDGAAPDAAVGAENSRIDPDLQSIIERWTKLPDAIKAGMLAMVQASDTMVHTTDDEK